MNRRYLILFLVFAFFAAVTVKAEKVPSAEAFETFGGTYKMTDKRGVTYTITLLANGSVDIKSSKSSKHFYTIWEGDWGDPVAKISLQEQIPISFPGGVKKPANIILADGYAYAGWAASDARSPADRLPIKHTGGKKMPTRDVESVEGADKHAGTYRFKDMAGKTYTITLNDDGTMVVKTLKPSGTFYGTWACAQYWDYNEEWCYVPYDYLSIRFPSTITWPCGKLEGKFYDIDIKGGYIYKSGSYQNEDPTRRLKITRIK